MASGTTASASVEAMTPFQRIRAILGGSAGNLVEWYDWFAYTSTSLTGTQAAVRAGLGIAVLPREMCPDFLTPLGRDSGLPELDDTEVALIEAQGASLTAHRFAQHIAAALERA